MKNKHIFFKLMDKLISKTINDIKTKRCKFYMYSFYSTCIGALNSVIATDASLYALNKNLKMTQNYVYKNIIGQSIGLGLTLLMKDKIQGNEYLIALGSITLQQISYTLDSFLYKSPHRYLLYKSISCSIQNISWIMIGAVNTKCIYNISQQSKEQKSLKNSQNINKEMDITTIYSEMSIVNTIGSSVGLYLGNSLVKKFAMKSLKISPLLYICQIGVYYKLLNNALT